MNHNHHNHCQHERLKYCRDCQRPYCLDCSVEWVVPTTVNWHSNIAPELGYTTSGNLPLTTNSPVTSDTAKWGNNTVVPDDTVAHFHLPA